MPSTRRDATRNRDHLLAVAQVMRQDGEPLQLNELARRAGLGVGTVYRHFPTVRQLTEVLVADRLLALEARAGDIADDEGFRGFLEHALGLLAGDRDFAVVATDHAPALESTRQARQRLVAALAQALERVNGRRRLMPGLRPDDVLLLLCGIAFALHAGGVEPQRAQLYVRAFFDGIFAPGPGGAAVRS